MKVDICAANSDDVYGSHNSQEALELIGMYFKFNEPQSSKNIQISPAASLPEGANIDLLPQRYRQCYILSLLALAYLLRPLQQVNFMFLQSTENRIVRTHI